MLSKFGPQAILSSVLIFVLGCGLKTGEKNSDPKPAKVQSARCLTQAISDLKVYFKGDATDFQVDSSLTCLEEVFVAFKENIRGQQKSAYTPREIATFIEINFLNRNDPKFSDNFLKELMFLKVALFGGDEGLISKNEIDSITAFVGRFKPDLVALNPYMKILTLSEEGQFSVLDESTKEKKFLAAKALFHKVIVRLTSEFSEGGRPYQMDHLLNFAAEILKFAQSKQDTIDAVAKAGPFLKKFKTHLIGGSPSLRGEEWKKLGMTLHEAYFQALRFEYFLKGLDEDQIEKKWFVYQKIALDLTGLIENLLKTKESRYLTNTEIIEILQPLGQLVPKVGELTEDMLNQLGDIKLVFLGDSVAGSRGWDERDFTALQKKIPTLFDNGGALLASYEALRPNPGSLNRAKLSYTEFLAEEAKFLNAVYNLGQLVEKSFDLESFHQLILGLAKGPLKDSFALPENFEKLYQAAIAGKELLTGESTTLVSAASLKLILNVGGRAYLNYSEYDLFMSCYDSNSVEFTSGLERLWPKVKTTLTTELNLRKGHVLMTAELVKFVLVLQKQELLTTTMTEISLTKAFDALWSHILNRSEDRLNSIWRPGLDLIAIEQISPEVETALGLQRHISEVFSTSGNWSRDSISLEFQKHLAVEENQDLKKALADISGFLLEAIPLNLNERGLLKINDSTAGEYHQKDLTTSNIARLISRVLIRGYASDVTRIAEISSVTQDEIQVAYTQLKPLAVDLDIVDKSNETFVKSRFLEANLFLSISNGDKLASFGELHHLIIHVLSGLSRAAEIKEDILKNCIQPDANGKKIAKGSTRIPESCLLDQYAVHEIGFSGMPKFLVMKAQYTPEQMRDYDLSLLKAAGHVPKDDKTVFMSDADLFPHVVQYIEMVYARHDINRDGLLGKEEALAAFPIFKDLLGDLVKAYKQIKPEDLPGVFVYILKYGRPPNPKSIGEVLKFVAFIKDKEQKDWAVAGTRLDLGKIFNYIADATINAPQAPTPSPTPVVPNPTPTPPQ